MRTTKLIIAITIFIVGSISCNDSNKDMENTKEPVVSTFYFIRHAEKDRTDPENNDPELNQDGLGRAIHWAEVFDPIDLDVIYSTNYERTSMTAAPTSVKKDIDVKYYDPKSVDIEAFKTSNEGLNVLVVGHSNSTPNFVNNLLEIEKYEHMDDHDNSSLFIVRIIDGVATDIRLKMD
ncbi:histidine phosphatase family protein [Flagellimonas aquimarina]|uniref:Histidine phosphatase family protein n=1 Tax=Flagellimonas aquimarina TaxID=2201895 RepID=A0A316L0Y5_9FLAO|nr:histidine phosphatase family protein [Allomuricauda koreensis]PWL38655.1 histidine phosphatase family protein [Allomuricauda koreensis]